MNLICHLGLGDAIILAGAAVYLSRKGPVTFPCRRAYLEQVRSFFIHHSEITVYPVASEADFFTEGALKSGYYKEKDPPRPNESFDAWFYRQLGIPLREKWDSSPLRKASRSCPQREPVFQSYSFLHDDPIRGFVIEPFHSLPVERPDPHGPSILSYVELIENAERIDVIDSCFLHLVESLNPLGYLYLHRSVRPETDSPFNHPKLRYQWNIR